MGVKSGGSPHFSKTLMHSELQGWSWKTVHTRFMESDDSLFAVFTIVIAKLITEMPTSTIISYLVP